MKELEVKSFNLLCGQEILDYDEKIDEALLTEKSLKICNEHFKKAVYYDS